MGRGGIRRRKPKRRDPPPSRPYSDPWGSEGTALGRYTNLAYGHFLRDWVRGRRTREWRPRYPEARLFAQVAFALGVLVFVVGIVITLLTSR
jgi:hypothetical protein